MAVDKNPSHKDIDKDQSTLVYKLIDEQELIEGCVSMTKSMSTTPISTNIRSNFDWLILLSERLCLLLFTFTIIVYQDFETCNCQNIDHVALPSHTT